MVNFKSRTMVPLQVKVTDLDGAPIQDEKNTVKLTYNYGWDDKEPKSLPEKPVPSTGIVTFELEPKKNTTHISFTVCIAAWQQIEKLGS